MVAWSTNYDLVQIRGRREHYITERLSVSPYLHQCALNLTIRRGTLRESPTTNGIDLVHENNTRLVFLSIAYPKGKKKKKNKARSKLFETCAHIITQSNLSFCQIHFIHDHLSKLVFSCPNFPTPSNSIHIKTRWNPSTYQTSRELVLRSHQCTCRQSRWTQPLGNWSRACWRQRAPEASYPCQADRRAGHLWGVWCRREGKAQGSWEAAQSPLFDKPHVEAGTRYGNKGKAMMVTDTFCYSLPYPHKNAIPRETTLI